MSNNDNYLRNTYGIFYDPMATFKVILKDKRKDGNYNVKIQIIHNGQPQFIKTEFYLTGKQINKFGRVKNHPNASIINARLDEMISGYERKLDEIFLNLNNLTAKQVKEYLTSSVKRNEVEFFTFMEEYIGNLKARYEKELETDPKASKKTLECYDLLQKSVRRFMGKEQTLFFKDIDKSWLEKYEIFLRDSGVKNGVWNRMKDLRHLFNVLINDERKLLSADYYPFKYYKISRTKNNPKPKIIELDQLVQFIANPPVNKFELNAYRIFLLDFYLIGINPIDLYFINNGGGEIVGDRLEFERSKTEVGHSIRLEPEALELIEQMKGEKATFEFQERYTNFENFKKNTNRSLKKRKHSVKTVLF